MTRSTRHQRLPASTSYLLTLLLLPAMVSAQQGITLRSFADPKAPVFSTLPIQCQSILQTSIAGCQTSDFDFKGSDKNSCSVACISGLQAIAPRVESACVNVQADPESIVGFFLRDEGVPALCKNIGIVAGPVSTPTRSTLVVSISTPAPAPPPAVSTSISATVVISSTVVTTDPAVTRTTSGGLIMDGSQPTGTQSFRPAQTVGGSGSGSGGGSPFDGGNSGSAGIRERVNMPTLLIALTRCVCGLLWI